MTDLSFIFSLGPQIPIFPVFPLALLYIWDQVWYQNDDLTLSLWRPPSDFCLSFVSKDSPGCRKWRALQQIAGKISKSKVSIQCFGRPKCTQIFLGLHTLWSVCQRCGDWCTYLVSIHWVSYVCLSLNGSTWFILVWLNVLLSHLMFNMQVVDTGVPWYRVHDLVYPWCTLCRQEPVWCYLMCFYLTWCSVQVSPGVPWCGVHWHTGVSLVQSTRSGVSLVCTVHCAGRVHTGAQCAFISVDVQFKWTLVYPGAEYIWHSGVSLVQSTLRCIPGAEYTL